MGVNEQIEAYLASQPDQKQKDLRILHSDIMQAMPDCQLWFLDGTDESGKVVSNPNIGYGLQHLHYADGKSKPFYQIGISANTSGISVYILGIKDKQYLAQTFGPELGKAKVTSYCIKFKDLKDINLEVLLEAVRFGASDQH